MLFLDNNDKVTILGEQIDSYVSKGCWFSNDFWDDNYETKTYDFADEHSLDDLNYADQNFRMATQDDD
jgi:hypothetical protein